MALAEIFGGQIDFNSDLKQGDRFEVLFEKSTREGQFAGYGDILGATFVADGKEHPGLPLDQSRRPARPPITTRKADR